MSERTNLPAFIVTPAGMVPYIDPSSNAGRIAAQEAAATAAIEKLVTHTSKSRGYDGPQTWHVYQLADEQIAAASEVEQPLLKLFRAETRALLDWYPRIWAYLAAIGNGLLPRPESMEALIADAPQIVWPEESAPR